MKQKGADTIVPAFWSVQSSVHVAHNHVHQVSQVIGTSFLGPHVRPTALRQRTCLSESRVEVDLIFYQTERDDQGDEEQKVHRPSRRRRPVRQRDRGVILFDPALRGHPSFEERRVLMTSFHSSHEHRAHCSLSLHMAERRPRHLFDYFDIWIGQATQLVNLFLIGLVPLITKGISVDGLLRVRDRLTGSAREVHCKHLPTITHNQSRSIHRLNHVDSTMNTVLRRELDAGRASRCVKLFLHVFGKRETLFQSVTRQGQTWAFIHTRRAETIHRRKLALESTCTNRLHQSVNFLHVVQAHLERHVVD